MKHKVGAFSSFCKKVAIESGHTKTFITALAIVFLWAISGPLFDYSNTWQLMINTGTTIVTFLMVFLIQHTQNCDTQALHLKLDELLRATKGAHTILLDLEELTEEDLGKFKEKYAHLAKEARKRLEQGKDDTYMPDVAFENPLYSSHN